MPINENYFVCFDFETGDRDPRDAEILQIAAVAINPRTLSIVPGSEFNSYIKPVDASRCKAEAMEVNKIRLEDLADAPELENVYTDFVNYCAEYNPKKSSYKAPIACGYNINNFDTIIIDRLAKQFPKTKSWDEGRQKNKLFNMVYTYDVLQIAWSFFENSDIDRGPENLKLTSLLKWAGIPTDGAHNAIVDTQRTALLVNKFLKMQRHVSSRIKRMPNEVSNSEI